jgi:hypothetical protein
MLEALGSIPAPLEKKRRRRRKGMSHKKFNKRFCEWEMFSKNVCPLRQGNVLNRT